MIRCAALSVLFLCFAMAGFAAGDSGGIAGPKVLGDPDAPVTLIEFASMSCPHCARFHTERLPEIKQKWIDTGKVRLEFRDFPLNAQAVFGAMLAHCAPPDRYFAWLDLIFQTQREWATAGFNLGGNAWDSFMANNCPRRDWPGVWQKLAELGRRGGMSAEKVGDCLCSRNLQNAVLQSRADAVREHDVTHTPSFVLDGELLDGVPTDSDLERALAAH